VLDLSPEKVLVLVVVALVVLGPNRLPAAARSLGRIIGQLRAMSASLQTEVRDALHEPHEAFTAALDELRPVTELRPGGVGRSVRRAVADTLAPPGQTPGSGPSAPAVPGAPPSQPPAPIPDDPAFN
jgi:sec-independent protein translocase protein TatB